MARWRVPAVEAAARAADVRPRLAVVYGHRSLDVMQIVEGARGWCDLVWLVDGEDPSVVAVRPILRKFGAVVDALEHSPERAAEALSAHAPDGLVTFYDTGMEGIAAVAGALGMRFHNIETARALEDKLYQREALRSAGLPTPRTADIPRAPTVRRCSGWVGRSTIRRS